MSAFTELEQWDDTEDLYSHHNDDNYYYHNDYNKKYNEQHNKYYNYNQKRNNRNYKTKNYGRNQQKGTWIIKSKNAADVIKRERNTSRGTILYCGPNAIHKNDVIEIASNGIIPIKPNECIRIIAFGCSHELHKELFIPNGDLLINAGDICNWRKYDYTKKIYKTPWDTWKCLCYSLNKVRNRMNNNFKYGMFVIPGNHDIYCQENENQIKSLLNKNNIQLLINQSKTIDIENNKNNLTLFGSPISWYRGKPSNAYQLHRYKYKDLLNKDNRCNKYFVDQFIANKFIKSNILITHGTPLGFGDCDKKGKTEGSKSLLDYIYKSKPKLFICCDYHGIGTGNHGYGVSFLPFNSIQNKEDKNGDFCIMLNVAIAHQPARYMRYNNIHRGVSIIDAKINNLL